MEDIEEDKEKDLSGEDIDNKEEDLVIKPLLLVLLVIALTLTTVPTKPTRNSATVESSVARSV